MNLLIPVLVQVLPTLGIEAVHAIADLVHGNPKRQDETDEVYIQRLNLDTDKLLADAAAKDKQVEGEEASVNDNQQR